MGDEFLVNGGVVLGQQNCVDVVGGNPRLKAFGVFQDAQICAVKLGVAQNEATVDKSGGVGIQMKGYVAAVAYRVKDSSGGLAAQMLHCGLGKAGCRNGAGIDAGPPLDLREEQQAEPNYGEKALFFEPRKGFLHARIGFCYKTLEKLR